MYLNRFRQCNYTDLQHAQVIENASQCCEIYIFNPPIFSSTKISHYTVCTVCYMSILVLYSIILYKCSCSLSSRFWRRSSLSRMAGFSGDEKVANSVSSVAYGPCYVNHYYISDFCDSEEDITECFWWGNHNFTKVVWNVCADQAQFSRGTDSN